jgi:hypothetical protein
MGVADVAGRHSNLDDHHRFAPCISGGSALPSSADAASERVRNAGENVLQIGADRLDGDDDHHRDQRRDQSVFDRRGTAIVTRELRENRQHNVLLRPGRSKVLGHDHRLSRAGERAKFYH